MTVLWCTVNYHTFQEDNVASTAEDYTIRKDKNLSTKLIAWLLNILSQNVNQNFRSNFTDDLF